MKFKLYTIEKR